MQMFKEARPAPPDHQPVETLSQGSPCTTIQCDRSTAVPPRINVTMAKDATAGEAQTIHDEKKAVPQEPESPRDGLNTDDTHGAGGGRRKSVAHNIVQNPLAVCFCRSDLARESC